MLFNIIVVTDAVGTILYCSPQIEAGYGWPPAELLGRPIFGLLTGPDTRINAQRAMALLGESTRLEGSFQSRSRDGALHTTPCTVIPIRAEGGQIRGVTLVMHALQDDQRTRPLLEASYARWRALLEHLPARVLMVSAEGEVIYSNAPRPRPDQAHPDLGQSVYEHMPAEAEDDTRRALEAA